MRAPRLAAPRLAGFLGLAALTLALMLGAAAPVTAQEAAATAEALTPAAPAAAPRAVHQVKLESPAQSGTTQAATRALTLDVNKSRIIRLSRPARDVLVANPAIADIALRSPDTAFVVGRKVGETNVYFFDADGHQIDGV